MPRPVWRAYSVPPLCGWLGLFGIPFIRKEVKKNFIKIKFRIDFNKIKVYNQYCERG